MCLGVCVSCVKAPACWQCLVTDVPGRPAAAEALWILAGCQGGGASDTQSRDRIRRPEPRQRRRDHVCVTWLCHGMSFSHQSLPFLFFPSSLFWSTPLNWWIDDRPLPHPPHPPALGRQFKLLLLFVCYSLLSNTRWNTPAHTMYILKWEPQGSQENSLILKHHNFWSKTDFLCSFPS